MWQWARRRCELPLCAERAHTAQKSRQTFLVTSITFYAVCTICFDSYLASFVSLNSLALPTQSVARVSARRAERHHNKVCTSIRRLGVSSLKWLFIVYSTTTTPPPPTSSASSFVFHKLVNDAFYSFQRTSNASSHVGLLITMRAMSQAVILHFVQFHKQFYAFLNGVLRHISQWAFVRRIHICIFVFVSHNRSTSTFTRRTNESANLFVRCGLCNGS